MIAESGGAACADVTECAPLVPGQGVAPGGEEFLLDLAKDIGDFKPRFAHCGLGSDVSAMAASSSASNGLRMAWIRRFDTCR